MADGGSFPGFERLRQSLAGEIYTDEFTRGRYATDASIYQMVPHGVVVPQSLADVEATISCCREQGIALLPRGGGTSQCGQTVNHAIVIDNSKYLPCCIDTKGISKYTYLCFSYIYFIAKLHCGKIHRSSTCNGKFY